jgi:L-serine dehydratase
MERRPLMTLPKRIRIKGWNDVVKQMKDLDIPDLYVFFLSYEAKNTETSEASLIGKMHHHLKVMKESIERGLQEPNRTKSGLIQGGAFHMKQFTQKGASLLNKSFSNMISRVLAVAELNACMGRIVASPTAGACGVLPGALMTIAENHGKTDEELVKSLFVAGGIGEIIALRASLSGSTHGCQAEVGSASAMTAGALAYIMGGSPLIVESAAAFALKNILGLVCDPVAGRVELPCVKRNVMGACNALACAEMALAGITTLIPLDEVIDAMAQIGNSMPCSLKETSQGGLAVSPSAQIIKNSILL